MKSFRGWVVLQCDIDCCNETNCNSNATQAQLAPNAINVLQKDGNDFFICTFVSVSFNNAKCLGTP